MVRKRQRLFRYAVDTFIELLEQVTKRKVNYNVTILIRQVGKILWILFQTVLVKNLLENF